jgi:hypothetical protein
MKLINQIFIKDEKYIYSYTSVYRNALTMKRTIDHLDDNSIKTKRSANNRFPYVLTIIDMQPKFEASNRRRILNHVRKLINDAKMNDAYIIYAEYEQCGRTHDSLTKLTNDYKHCSFVHAYQNSKCDAIKAELARKSIMSDKMVICGVNTDACVQATVNDLSIKLPKWSLEIAKTGCYTYSNIYPHNKYNPGIEAAVLRTMAKLPNVTII